MERCEICGGTCRPGVAPWQFRCDRCGSDLSTLQQSINAASADIELDEEARVRALADMRRKGYEVALANLRELRGSDGGDVLEVGSAYGWFLESARPHFDALVGIEPDDAVRRAPAGAIVRAGFFPQALRPEEQFDVVVFNDVFEHIPHTHDVAAAVASALKPSGIAVVSLPVTSGAIYRLSKVLYRVGLRGPFERMWQLRFPSPHLFYFSPDGLDQVFAEHGLRRERVIPMPTMRLSGLWQRIRYGEPRRAKAVISYAASLVAMPLVTLAPADVQCFYFRKVEAPV